MSERRAHWDDELLDHVADTLGACVVSMMTVPDDIYEVIAAVEDRLGDSAALTRIDSTLANVELREAEVQVQAVRDVLHPTGGRVSCVCCDRIRTALDGAP